MEQHSVARASFFGSYAHGTYNSESDIDIIVEFEVARVGLRFFSLREDLTTTILISLDLEPVFNNGLPGFASPIFRQSRRLYKDIAWKARRGKPTQSGGIISRKDG